MITVYFPKYIRSLTNGVDNHSFDDQSLPSILEGIRMLFPDLSLYISNINSRQCPNLLYFIDKDTGKVITSSLSGTIKANNLVLIITIYGSGEDVTNIAIGAALVAASFIPGLQGVTIPLLGTQLTGFLATTGISFMLSGVLNALSSRPGSATPQSVPDTPVRNNNNAFEGLVNTATTDMPIALVYGQHRVAGQFIGGKIKTINHDKDTIINVSSYI